VNFLRPEVSILLAKELRQVRRSRGALASATLLPLFLMTAMPLGQLFIARSAPLPTQSPSRAFVPPGMAEVADDPTQLLVSVMLPMFIVLGGLIVPSISATYTVVAEREKRSLDLLMALPVSVTDILLAKLLAMLVLAAVVVLPLFAIDMAVLVALGLTSAVDILLLLVLLLAAMGCSVGVALLLALLAIFGLPTTSTARFLGHSLWPCWQSSFR
jgi:ABC-type transport system involved in multi-copper enzyme maturation permease subunit